MTIETFTSTKIGGIELDGTVFVETTQVFVSGGEEVGRKKTRRPLTPIDDISGETEMVKLICGVVWTQSVIDAFIAKWQSHDN